LADAPVAEPVDFPERQERSTKLPLVASVGREQVALIVPVAKVVGRRAQIHQVAEKQKAAHPVGATARRVAVQELGAKEQERVFPKRLVSQVLRQVQPGGQAAEPPAQRAPDWQRKAELRARQLVQAARLERASEQQPEARSQRAPREQQASELPPLAVALPVLQQARSARAQQEPQPDASVPPSPLHLSRLCPPWLSLRRPLLHPQRREGACEPSRRRQPESSWSGSFFLVRRTRARGR
jgi:hypothetical protein